MGDPRQGKPGRYPDETPTNEFDQSLEGDLVSFDWNDWMMGYQVTTTEDTTSEGSPVMFEDDILFGELLGPILEGPCLWD